MSGAANLHFFARLIPLLSRATPDGRVRYRFDGHPAVKDAIEALGIPHTEVDLIIAAGRSVGFEHRLQDGDRVEVYPFHQEVPLRPLRHLGPPVPQSAAFILDVHLGKLARRLRLLGFDCRYRNDYADAEIVRLALAEQRIILTRDRGILKQGIVEQGLLLSSGRPDEQVREVLERYRLFAQLRPWQRCPVCNGQLEAVDKVRVLPRLLPNTARHGRQFRLCSGCGKLYWRGAHHAKIAAWVDPLLASRRGKDETLKP